MGSACICLDCGRTVPAELARYSRCPRCQPAHEAKRRAQRRRSGEGTRTPEGQRVRAEHQAIITSPAYRKVRDAVRRRDGCCLACGTTERLQVHHVVPVREAPHLALDPENMVTVCARCHGRVEAAARRRRESSGQQRPSTEPPAYLV